MLFAMGRLSTKCGKWVNRAGDLLFPPCCLFCHASVKGSGCCRACLQDIQPFVDSVCARCGKALSEDLAPGPCGKCLRSPPFQIETTALFAYQGAVRDAILAWKLGGDDAAVHWLIETSSQRLKALFKPDDLLLPVPMPLSRMRKSGQHHAADLTRMIADVVGCEWEWQLLRRRGEQERQSALSGVARRKNLRKSFHLNNDYLQSIQLERSISEHGSGRIWIVDDILTSGATLHCASKALRSLRQPVYAFSLARTLHER